MAAVPRRPSRADPARRLAWEALQAVHQRDAYANLLVPGLLSRSDLPERDRGLVAELAYGTLRAEGTLDHVLLQCSSRPLAAVDPALLDVLRLGAYQLLRTRMPRHAAVDTAVELARAVAGEGPARFANAVLRRLAARDGDLGAPACDEDPVGHLAVTTAHPRWVVEAYRDALGDLTEAGRALAADDERPEVHLVARPGRVSRDELLAECAQAGLSAAAGPWSPYAVRLAGGHPSRIPAVADGRAGVQDEGSQLVALVADRLGLLTPRARVLDMCAGPGGKAALLAGLMAGRAGLLLAADVRAHRARLVAGSLAAATAGEADRLTAGVVQADGRRWAWRAGGFDVVLLDAPCTGLGALRRRPEARWRRRPEEVPELQAGQGELLLAALTALRPGGTVVYAVCSPHLAEGRAVVGTATEQRPDVSLVDVRPALEGMPELGDGPWVQLWTHRHGTDAMFLSLLRRDGPEHPPVD